MRQVALPPREETGILGLCSWHPAARRASLPSPRSRSPTCTRAEQCLPLAVEYYFTCSVACGRAVCDCLPRLSPWCSDQLPAPRALQRKVLSKAE